MKRKNKQAKEIKWKQENQKWISKNKFIVLFFDMIMKFLSKFVYLF